MSEMKVTKQNLIQTVQMENVNQIDKSGTMEKQCTNNRTKIWWENMN